MLDKLKKNQFLFEELVSRDFKQKYKRTSLGMIWSVLSPLLTLLVLQLVFGTFFGKDTPYFTVYIFAGVMVMTYYKEATKGGMSALMANAKIFTKINVPKYLFVFSKNVSALINFLLMIPIFLVLCLIFGLPITPKFLCLIYPSLCLLIMNVGIGMILSACFIFFRDVQYLYDVFLTLLNYCSAIFYTIDRFKPQFQMIFMCNPVYVYIKYFRVIAIDGNIPSLQYHGLCAFYALLFFGIGCWFYKHYNHQFLYYV